MKKRTIKRLTRAMYAARKFYIEWQGNEILEWTSGDEAEFI